MKHHPKISRTSALYTISIVGFFATLHVALPTYFNSSFLATFTDEKTIGVIYTIVAIVSVLALLSVNTVLRKYGNYKTSLLFIVVQMILFAGILFSNSPYVTIPLFIAAMAVTVLIGFTLDIFLEKNTDTSHTGGIRGMYMTVLNSAWVLSPFLGAAFIVGDNYRNIYLAGLAFLLPLIYLIKKNFSNFIDPHYPDISVFDTFKKVIGNKDLIRLFSMNIVLQTFYAWMAVYTPIYLNKVVGFDWYEISIIFTIMLIPFILIELPLGKIADKKWGEKEILAMGFGIMGLATCMLSFIDYKNLIVWSLALFMTRIGAAACEIMTETYFFKKVDKKDSEILSMFRVTRPISYFFAPIITTVGLVYTTDRNLFIVLGIICIFTAFPALKLRDTN